MGSPQRTLASPKPNLQISKYHAVLQGRGGGQVGGGQVGGGQVGDGQVGDGQVGGGQVGGGQVGGGQVVCMLYSDNLNLNHI